MSQKQIMLVIYGLMAGMFLSSLDQTIVGTAIRTIGDDLHGLDQQAWVTTAYLITSTIATPIYGKLSDIFGRRPLYIFSITVFILGSLLSSFSTSMYMLAAFRAFQGIGAGGLMSLPLAIMGDMLAPRERAKYQGYFLAVFGVSSVIGPLVGGLFAGTHTIAWIAGWRWVFLVNVPIGIIALAMVIAFLHLPRFNHNKHVRVDWWGATAVVLALVPLLMVAEQGRVWGWTSAASLACFGIGVVGIVAFIIIESRMGRDAIIPLSIFRSRVFSMATVLGALVGFGMFGAMMTLPLYLQIVMGMSPTESGFATLPMIGGLMVASIVSGQIIARTGRYRQFPIIGTAFVVLGFLDLTFITADTRFVYIAGGMVLIGLGLGQLMQSLVLASQNSVAPTDMGVATSSATFFRQIGGTLGTAILLSVLFASMTGNIRTAMQDKDTLTDALDAAMTPAVAQAPQNAGAMRQIWTPIVTPIEDGVQAQLDQAAAQATSHAPNEAAKQVILQQVAAQAGATVKDGRIVVDYSNDAQRRAIVDKTVPTVLDGLAGDGSGTSTSGDVSTSDTSFLNGADARLTRPFLVGFTKSAVSIYWVGMSVLLIAFVLTWFFKVPELRMHSALQEQANRAAANAEETAAGAGPTTDDGSTR
ncbi:MDR family MFS transporter [Raineyella sp. LH-20]|uniref:MDR family MFS transporter n=1 Tax=Raineyella sp. LH-20 TaxID=3081204 RepID=UPI002955615D|nr:MDR family MFS transporter [Raineyella sp. LH-20]WOP18562.1 MDR family MFS transporter [Raineyella sp. LH-20]